MILPVFRLRKPNPIPQPDPSRQFLQNLILAIIPGALLGLGGAVGYLAFEMPKAMQNQNKIMEIQNVKMQNLSEQISDFVRKQQEWQKDMEQRMGRVEQKVF
jgi:hypothetical protein